MKIRGLARALAVAGGMLPGLCALADYSVQLNSASCNPGGTISVSVDVSQVTSANVAGGQFFLSFDASRLQFSSISYPSGVREVFRSVNNSTGRIDLAVGIADGGTPRGTGSLATIVFTTAGTTCGTSGLVSFRSSTPPSRLTNSTAQALTPFSTSNLGAVYLNDTSAPVINAGNPLAPVADVADPLVCTRTRTITAPSVTDNCSFTLSATIGGNSYDWTQTYAFPAGTTVITWTATDPCGNSSSTTQSVVITDTQIPTITCPANVIVSNTPGLCSASVNVGSPSANDNCGVQSVTGSRSDSLNLSSPYPVGVTTITWTATDVNGNTAQCQQTISVNDTEPPVIACPASISVNSDAGGCGASVSVGTATASDNCGINSITGVRSDLLSLSASYPVGTTTITWTALDIHGNLASCQQTVTVSANNTLAIAVELLGASSGTATRCLSLNLYSASSCPNPAYSVQTNVTFVNGSGSAIIDLPCGSGPYTSITATDPKHTLRRTSPVSISGVMYSASLTGQTFGLIGGNVNNDEYIDILDFGGYIGLFGTFPGADTDCSASLNADFDANGSIGTEDFTFIQANFLRFRDNDPCGNQLQIPANQPGGPVTDISVVDLARLGLRNLARADRNLDNRLNTLDVAQVLTQGYSTKFASDFTGDGVVATTDIFDFLKAYFMNHPRADFNNNGGVNVTDIFEFLGVWFRKS